MHREAIAPELLMNPPAPARRALSLNLFKTNPTNPTS
jgi:hypothetical protein